MNLNIKKYLEQKAQEINIEPRLLLALAVLEAKSKGLHAQDTPVILFERHIFYRLLKKQGFDVDKLSLKSPTLINKTPGGYLGGLKENERLRQACAINAELAYQSASYGLFQIMGFHALALGYQSGQDFAKQMGQSELNQCDAFIRFLISTSNHKMFNALKNKDFKTFARLYNGVNFAKNKYDIKLANIYNCTK